MIKKKKKRNKNDFFFVHQNFSAHMRLCRGLEMKGTFEDVFRETI